LVDGSRGSNGREFALALLSDGASIHLCPDQCAEASVAKRGFAPLLLSLLLQLPIVGQAAAYTGGPQLVDFLGWDSRTHRVYFHTVSADESFRFGGVYYFDLNDKAPSQRIQVAWSRGASPADDQDKIRRLRSLKRRLTPLMPLPDACLGWGTKVLSADSVRSPGMGVRARFRLLYTSQSLVRFECTGFGTPEVCLKNTYAIFATKARLYVLAFRGNLNDIAATQVAVLVPESTDQTIRVEWVRDK
jgi:hypothetical protein